MNHRITRFDVVPARVQPASPAAIAILVDAREASRLLAISPRTLWQLTKQNTVPSVRIGRSVRYRITDLDEWARKQSTGD